MAICAAIVAVALALTVLAVVYLSIFISTAMAAFVPEPLAALATAFILAALSLALVKYRHAIAKKFCHLRKND